jgi:hypothetical protein
MATATEREGYWTRKARNRIAAIGQIDDRRRTLQKALARLDEERKAELGALSVELTEMRRKGEPETGWAKWWRVNELGDRS